MAKRGKDPKHPWREDPQAFKDRTGFWPTWASDHMEASGELQEIATRYVNKYTSQIQSGEVTVDDVQKMAFAEIQSKYVQPEEVDAATAEGQLMEIDKELDALSFQFKTAFSAVDRSRIMGEKRQLLERRKSISLPLVKEGLINPVVQDDGRHYEISEEQASAAMNYQAPAPNYRASPDSDDGDDDAE